MKTNIKCLALITTLGILIPGYAFAADQAIYGSQLMTQQERMEYRTKMQSLKTKEERERFRMQHHEQMQERAKKQGVTLPDMPPSKKGHMNNEPGKGMGNGMGGGGGRR